MANLVRIRDVHVYTALGEKAVECVNVLKLLKDNNVPFNHLNWSTDEALSNQQVFEPISTWSWSADAENFEQKVFASDATSLPFVHWRNVFDNDTSSVNCAVGLSELQNSQLFANLDKVVRPS